MRNSINKRLNKHRNDVNRKDNIPASNNFNTEGHNFKSHVKFIIIEKLNQKILTNRCFENE